MENKRNTTYLIPIAMAVSMALGLYMGNFLTPQKDTVLTTGESRYKKIQDIIQILDQRYVDSIDSEELFETTISDMLHNLDPHSNYIAAKDLKRINEVIDGKFGGVGIRFFIIRDTVCITNVIPFSPAEISGLQSGDKILSVDNKSIVQKKITNEELMDLLKGIEGTAVDIKVIREGKVLKKSIVRGSIPVESILAAYMIDDHTGYIRIEQFSVATSFEFRRAADALRKKGLKKLILDVRDNGGGVLTGATEIADEFLKAQIPIVKTKGAHSDTYTYKATKEGTLEDVDLVVLINSNSASASEILAGAIQDNDRGTIIGRRSFGKGLVQEDVPLRDGSNLRLTIARYYTPTGRCIQKSYTADLKAYYNDHRERYENGEMYEVDSSLFIDSLKFVTPKGKIVYGGGGIMPDIFVPYDTSGTSWYFTELRFTSVFQTFAFDFVRGKRKKWSSFNDFNANFKVTDNILNQFVEFAWNEYQIKKDNINLARSRNQIAEMLKAEIARQIWVEQGFYQIMNLSDPDVLSAIKSLR